MPELAQTSHTRVLAGCRRNTDGTPQVAKQPQVTVGPQGGIHHCPRDGLLKEKTKPKPKP